MYERPDYQTARAEAGFGWSVGTSYITYLHLADVPVREFFLRPEACIEVYRIGRARARELLPQAEVRFAGPATPPISYGHANGLGSELMFPEGGEVAHTHPYGSLDEGIEALKQPVDFASAGMAPFYIAFRRRLQEAFPGEEVGFGYGLEGPITTAYELRGQDIYSDMLQQPERTGEFLALVVESILEFHRFRCRLDGTDPVSAEGSGMCDDLASLISPRLYEQLVVPFWDRFFAGRTTGRRSAHVENLQAPHLPYLEQVGLAGYDPSVSPKLSPPLIRDHCRVPFTWRLVSFHYRSLTCSDIRDWVFQAAADGASGVRTSYTAQDYLGVTVQKVQAFIDAAGEAERMLGRGADRADLAREVSAAGRGRFWDHWPE
jgi:hypothetical protein